MTIWWVIMIIFMWFVVLADMSILRRRANSQADYFLRLISAKNERMSEIRLEDENWENNHEYKTCLKACYDSMGDYYSLYFVANWKRFITGAIVLFWTSRFISLLPIVMVTVWSYIAGIMLIILWIIVAMDLFLIINGLVTKYAEKRRTLKNIEGAK